MYDKRETIIIADLSVRNKNESEPLKIERWIEQLTADSFRCGEFTFISRKYYTSSIFDREKRRSWYTRLVV